MVRAFWLSLYVLALTLTLFFFEVGKTPVSSLYFAFYFWFEVLGYTLFVISAMLLHIYTAVHKHPGLARNNRQWRNLWDKRFQLMFVLLIIEFLGLSFIDIWKHIFDFFQFRGGKNSLLESIVISIGRMYQVMSLVYVICGSALGIC